MSKLVALSMIFALATGCAAAPKPFLAPPPRTSGPSAEPTPPSPKTEVERYLAPPAAFAKITTQTQTL